MGRGGSMLLLGMGTGDVSSEVGAAPGWPGEVSCWAQGSKSVAASDKAGHGAGERGAGRWVGRG